MEWKAEEMDKLSDRSLVHILHDGLEVLEYLMLSQQMAVLFVKHIEPIWVNQNGQITKWMNSSMQKIVLARGG